ncbi:4208_t:CDS:10 [Paraglomus brasilianum]|uniref:4208_t:CDS:1 n=1 Tax=Paraglomus brasilianum TaxID=144538 RepID=A0A9N9BJQ0_9GLOM|nr:4208_t:CDS:10 [Paraglomus brasilianum]
MNANNESTSSVPQSKDEKQPKRTNVFAQPHFRTRSRLSFREFQKSTNNPTTRQAKTFTPPLKSLGKDVFMRNPVAMNSNTIETNLRHDDTTSTPTQDVRPQQQDMVSDTHHLESETEDIQIVEQEEFPSSENNSTKTNTSLCKLTESFDNVDTSPQVRQIAQKLFSPTAHQQQTGVVTTRNSNLNAPYSIAKSNTSTPLNSPTQLQTKLTNKVDVKTPTVEQTSNNIQTDDKINEFDIMVSAVNEWQDEITEKNAKIENPQSTPNQLASILSGRDQSLSIFSERVKLFEILVRRQQSDSECTRERIDHIKSKYSQFRHTLSQTVKDLDIVMSEKKRVDEDLQQLKCKFDALNMTREILIEDHKSVLAAHQEQLIGITTQNKKLLDENRILQSDSDRLKRNLLIIAEYLSHQAAELESSHAQLKKLQEEREADKSKHIECEKRVNILSSDLKNAKLTLEASREEISRLVSACMEKDKRLRNDRAEELRLGSELQLLRQQLDEVVQEKEHRFDIFVYDGYYQRFSHGLTVHATSNHSDSHLAVIEKASVAVGTSDCPDMDLARQHAMMLQIFGKNCMDYNLREQELQRKLDETKANTSKFESQFNNLQLEYETLQQEHDKLLVEHTSIDSKHRQSIEQTLNRAAQYYQDLANQAAVNHNNEVCKRDSKIHELESIGASLQEEIRTLQNTLASMTDKRKELDNNSTNQITRTEVLDSSNDGQGFPVGNETSANVLEQALNNPQIPLSSSSTGINEQRLSDDSQQPTVLPRLKRRKMILATANSDRENEPFVENRPGKLKYNLNTENYHFYVIEIETGAIKDKIVYENDKIYANHHSGVSMLGNLFAVLSVQYQTIYINLLRDDGRIIKLHNIGYYAFEDDELIIAQHEKMEEKFQANHNHTTKKGFGMPCVNNIEAKTDEDNMPYIQSTSPVFYPSACNNNRDDQVVPTIESDQTQKQQRNVKRSRGFLVPSTGDATPLIGGIKHRVLSYLYRLACNKTDRNTCVEHFYRTFPQLELLTMWRMQFIDESHFLIKFACPDCVSGRHSETVGHPCLFAVYNYQTTEVVAVYDNASKEFLDIFKDYCDHLRFVAFNQPFHFDANCSNNIYAREYWNKYKHSLKQRLGGEIAARRRLLSVLPYGPQTYSETPFFDISLFAYDEKFHLSCERQVHGMAFFC